MRQPDEPGCGPTHGPTLLQQPRHLNNAIVIGPFVLWATWYPPCLREMPMLHHAQVDRPSVNFVFLNRGEPADKVGAWLQARNLPMRDVLARPGCAGRVFGDAQTAPGSPAIVSYETLPDGRPAS